MSTKRFKKQHRTVASDMSLKAWALYISKGDGEWSKHAALWLTRKAAA
jgi:hypothetical protein